MDKIINFRRLAIILRSLAIKKRVGGWNLCRFDFLNIRDRLDTL